MLILTISVVVLGFFNICNGVKFKFCKASDANFDNCLTDAMQNALELLTSDVPEYGLESLKVYKIPSLIVEAGTGAVHLVQHYNNMELSGITDGTIKEAHYDKDKKILSFTLLIPKLRVDASYNIDGKLLELPITGDGPAVIEFYNLNMKTVIVLDEYPKDGTTHFKIKSFKVEMPITKLHVRLDNLFGGNKLLGDNMNKMMNDEWELLYMDQKAHMEKSFAKEFEKFAQNFFDHVPADDLF